MISIIEKLDAEHSLTFDELRLLIDKRDTVSSELLREKASAVRRKYYGNRIYIRGLIEFTNYCKNDCFYCGIRRSNKNVSRYRLTKDDILSCCREGYSLGYRTFVLQGGEDPFYSTECISDIVYRIKSLYPDCAVTLSFGEHPHSVYKEWFSAGADRYLLRHETADSSHYARLHPVSMSFDNRMKCLQSLRDIGYQTGCGFMVGSPFQTPEHIVKDLLFMKNFSPEMVGIGPFIPQKDTPFGIFKAGTAELTVYLISIIRLLLPTALIPSTTALSSIDEKGRQKGILAGANVCMPNLSPSHVRKNYAIYDNKLSVNGESAQNLDALKKELSDIGFCTVTDRGDHIERI